MRQKIIHEITRFVAEYQKRDDIATEFGKPLVAFADAKAAEIQNLPSVVSPDHLLPQDVIPDASVIVSYYVPFTKALAATNPANEEGIASPEWARAYEELNGMFVELNRHLVAFIAELGSYKASVIEAASQFDTEKLISNWSHRHVAHAAGLGTFGVNNMLISPVGCCGRYNSVVTNIPVDIFCGDSPDAIGSPMTEELCDFKRDGSCGVCIKSCPSGALSASGNSEEFNRSLCFEVCSRNAEIYPQKFFSSYPGNDAVGNEVCGKCVTSAPCAFRD